MGFCSIVAAENDWLVFPEFIQESNGNTSIWIDRELAHCSFVNHLADADRLLRDPQCEIIKDQKKITVGRLTMAIGDTPHAIYIKRYNISSLRHRLGSLFVRSGALRALRGAMVLRGLGIPIALPIAAVECRVWGVLAKSFFISEEISGAKTADAYWSDELRTMAGATGILQRREFLMRLGELFRSLHGQQIYHNDLKDANIMATAKDNSTSFFLLDLEGVRRFHRLSDKRRIKNLVQLHRTLGRYLRRSEKLRFLKHYLGATFSERKIRRHLIASVLRQSDKLDREKATP